jgi:hypothetical protein
VTPGPVGVPVPGAVGPPGPDGEFAPGWPPGPEAAELVGAVPVLAPVAVADGSPVDAAPADWSADAEAGVEG